MAGKAGITIALSLLLGATACQRFTATPEDRINAAMPVAEETRQAKHAFDDLVKQEGVDAKRIDDEFGDRLKMRALECAHGYSPSWLNGEDNIRTQLTDSACFEKFDQSLARWIGLRHAGMLLAAPPLRPVPAKPAPYLVASERISDVAFARQAGIAVLNTDKQHEVFDLGSGERLQQIARDGRNFLVDISDNGRLLAVNQNQAVTVLDLERGRPLLRLDNVRDQRLFWVGKAGTLYVPEKERAPLFVDLLSGRESRIPATIGGVSVLAPTSVAGRYALLGFTRHALIDVSQDAQGWGARLAQETDAEPVVGHWARNGLNAGASTYISSQNGLNLLDLRTLRARKIDFKPATFSKAVPTPNPDEIYLFGHYRAASGFEHQALVYAIGKHTLTPAQVGKRLSSTVAYIPSIKHNALIDDFKLTLLDRLVDGTQAPATVDAYLQQLPAPEIPALPTAASNDAASAAARAAWLEQLSRNNAAPGVDPRLAMLAKMANIEAVGVYEGEGAVHSAGSSTRISGTVSVTVRRGRPVILVLSSYEPVKWQIRAEAGAKVLAVLQGGYHPSQVSGLGDARIYNIGRNYAYKRGDSNYTELNREIAQWTGKPIDTFQGTYRGGAFQVGDGM